MAEQKKKKKFRLTLRTKNSLKGLVFVTPFIIGAALFFISPIIFSVRIAFAQEVKILGMKLSGFTLEQFKRAISVDKEFVPTFMTTVKNTLTSFPLTVVLSLIIAILLNKNIKGRGLFRVIFLSFWEAERL